MKTRIGILTGGGDCPGLNTVLDSLVKSLASDYEIIGFYKGFEGLYNNSYTILDANFTNQFKFLGGTILKTVNKGHFSAKTGDGLTNEIDQEIINQTKQNYLKLNLEALIVLGGDGSLSAAYQLQQNGLNIIGVPKSIDNDVMGTDTTFGFLTAVQIAVEALDRLETTARSHERVMVLEVMGRNSGWIGLHSGIAGGANIILIPEIVFDYKKILEVIQKRYKNGKTNTLIVVSEGATSMDENKSYSNSGGQSSENLLGGIGEKITLFLNQNGLDARSTRLGHIQRGGSPLSMDRLLSIQMGVYAAKLVEEKIYGQLVCYNSGQMGYKHLVDCISKLKLVDPNGELVLQAKKIGISFGN
jgi:6-phosphofructokinase 1